MQQCFDPSHVGKVSAQRFWKSRWRGAHPRVPVQYNMAEILFNRIP